MSAVATRFHTADGVIAVERVQDCTPIAEHCTTLRHETRQTGDLRLAARLPAVLVEMYLTQRGISFNEFVANPEHARSMLNDPALAAFRVWEGQA